MCVYVHLYIYSYVSMHVVVRYVSFICRVFISSPVLQVYNSWCYDIFSRILNIYVYHFWQYKGADKLYSNRKFMDFFNSTLYNTEINKVVKSVFHIHSCGFVCLRAWKPFVYLYFSLDSLLLFESWQLFRAPVPPTENIRVFSSVQLRQ